MNYKLAQLVIHDPHHSQKAGEILIQPAQEDQESDLFILIEIDSNKPLDHQFIHQFLEIAYGAYEKSQLHEPNKILENILQNLNEYLPPLAPKISGWLDKLHCFVSIFSQETIHFSTFGKIKTYLIKPAAIKYINSQPEESNNKVLFNHTLSGSLQPGDRFLITTESLTDYLSLEKIKKIISTLPPQSSVAHLTNILEAVPPQVSFFSIILTMPPKSRFLGGEKTALKAGKLSIPSGSKNSLDQLLKIQRETEKILTPPSLIEILKEKLKSKSHWKKRTSAESIKVKVSAKKIPPLYRKANLATFLNRFLLFCFKNLFLAFKKLWELITQKTNRNQLTKKLTARVHFIVKKFANLSKANKILIILLVICLLLLSQSLTWQGQKLKGLKTAEAYQNLLTQINDKQNSIEAALIYNDTIRSKQLIAEIHELLNQFPKDSKERIKEYQKISAQVQVLFEKVWKAVNILEPVALINFREINLTAEINSLGYKDGYIYGFNNSSQLFAVNTENNNTLVMEHFNLKVSKTNLFPKTNNLIVATIENKFYTIKENGIQEVPASLPGGLQQIDDLSFYLDKMYLLDRQSKQIFRLTYSGSDFRNAKAWINEDLPVDQTTSFTVDGYIYALQEDGTILKLSKGQNQSFPKIIVEPKLANPAKIYTEEESDNLYILDPANNRFLIISKDGELKKQYYSIKFNNLKDFVVREKEKKVYLLNGAQVFVIAIQ